MKLIHAVAVGVTAVVLTLLLVILGIGIRFWPDSTLLARSAQPIVMPAAPAVDPEAIVSLLPRDSIPAIDDPRFERVSQAGESLGADERVIGLVINGEARAYPIPILSAHEIVNDVVGGEPVAITWCPLCYTALVFSRRIDGLEEPLSFGVSGKLLHNTLVMYDRQTETLWSQLYGAAVAGRLEGRTLSFFPSQFTSWAAWESQYPDSLVLSKRLTCVQFACGSYAENPRGSYEVDAYASYYNTPDEGVVNHQLLRDETISATKKRVLGVRLAGKAKAYPYEVLRRQPLIHDEINGVPLLIWFDPATQTASAFVRRLEEQVLTFQADPDDPGLLVDWESDSRWQALSGVAMEGRLRGRRLPGLMATSAFAFGWYDYFPGSETYTLEP